MGSGAATGGLGAGLAGGVGSLVGAIPGILASALTPKDADAKTQAVSNIGAAAAAPAATVAGGATAGAMSGAGAAAGAAAALPAAGLALPALAMAIGMSMDAMRQEKNVKAAVGRLETFMSQQPELRKQWEQQIGDVTGTLNRLKTMSDSELNQAVNQSNEAISGLATAKSNALSGGGTTSAASALYGVPHQVFGGTAMSNPIDLQRQALLDTMAGLDETSRRGQTAATNPYFTPSDVALEFAPDYFKQHHTFDTLTQLPTTGGGADVQNWLADPKNQSSPYYQLMKDFGASGGNLDELTNIGRKYGMATEDLTSSHTLNQGDRNVWDPQSLALLQGMKPGNYISTLEGMGFTPGAMSQPGGPATPASGGFVPGADQGPSGEAGKAVGRLQPRNVITGLQTLPRPESDARTEAVFGMRRPGVQGHTDQSSGPSAPPPVPGTTQAEPRSFGHGSGFAVAPGGNIGTGGLVTQLPFGSGPSRANNGGM